MHTPATQSKSETSPELKHTPTTMYPNWWVASFLTSTCFTLQTTVRFAFTFVTESKSSRLWLLHYLQIWLVVC